MILEYHRLSYRDGEKRCQEPLTRLLFMDGESRENRSLLLANTIVSPTADNHKKDSLPPAGLCSPTASIACDVPRFGAGS